MFFLAFSLSCAGWFGFACGFTRLPAYIPSRRGDAARRGLACATPLPPAANTRWTSPFSPVPHPHGHDGRRLLPAQRWVAACVHRACPLHNALTCISIHLYAPTIVASWFLVSRFPWWHSALVPSGCCLRVSACQFITTILSSSLCLYSAWRMLAFAPFFRFPEPWQDIEICRGDMYVRNSFKNEAENDIAVRGWHLAEAWKWGRREGWHGSLWRQQDCDVWEEGAMRPIMKPNECLAWTGASL